MKPYIHAKISAKKYGGKPEDYLPLHDWMDSTKKCLPDVRHRAILHSSFGCYLAEQFFGHNLINSDGKKVSVRDLAEDHIIDDLGFLPTVEHWLKNMRIEPWMNGERKKQGKKRIISLKD